jgi:hypothetical protein
MPVKVYDGTNWVTVAGDGAQGATGASGTAPLTTKGDLLGFDTAANRVAVGTNGQSLVADSTATAGIRWQDTYAAGKNAVINGDFGINQRVFTSTSTDNTYGFDRWRLRLSGATATYSAQTFSLGTAPVAGYEGKNFARVAVTTGNDFLRFEQYIESVRTFANQTVTLSFWAKGTNPTTAGNLKAYLQQYMGTGGSPSADVLTAEQTFVLTADWTRYSLTFTVGSLAGKTLGTNNNDALVVVFGQGSNTSTDSYTLDIWGVQLEAGSVATPFTTATGTIAGELAACQRYCYVQTNATATNERIGLGGLETTTQAAILVNFPVSMRTKPTLTVVNQTAFTLNTYLVQVAASTVALSGSVNQTLNTADLTVTFSATGAGGNTCRLFNAGTGVLTYSAEL